MKKNLKRLACIAGVLGSASMARANIPYVQSFETDTVGWNPSAPATITRVPSGGGVLGVSSSNGAWHAEITNPHDNYAPGYGDSGSTYFGGQVQNYAYDYRQSVDVYVNTAWAAPSNPAVPAFWIDNAPANSVTGLSDYRDEHSFQFLVNGSGSVDVSVDGTSPVASITSSGWYRFNETFNRTGNGVTPVANSFSITSLATASQIGATVNISSPLMPSNELGGNSYSWIALWQNGFANDVLAIDRLNTNFVPEPASLGVLAIGGLVLARRPRRKGATG